METTTDQTRPLRGIVLDVDGTLLDPAHRITPATGAAVARAREAGWRVVLASGRSPRAMVEYMRELDLDGPAIGFNGALTFRLAGDAIEPLAGTPLDRDAAVEVLAMATARSVEIGWFTLDGWRVSSPGAAADEEAALTDEPPLVDPALPDGAPTPYKLMAIAVTESERRALEALRSDLPASVRGVFSHPRYLEVIAPGIDKAVAVREACAAWGLTATDLAAVGDAENDIGMLRQAGAGVAMGNASRAVMDAAAWVTATNAQDGAAVAIQRLLDGS
jgi:Cof subfamily protein (haloacid dehalogenase superfamily)